MKNVAKESLQNKPSSFKSWQDMHDSFILQQILAWTNGQPLLTSRIQQLIGEKEPQSELEQNPAAVINQIVQNHFKPDIINSDDPQDREIVRLLKNIQDALLKDGLSLQLLDQYKDILVSIQKKPYISTLEQNQLLKIGLISTNAEGCLIVSNPIYKKIFSLDWTEQQLERRLSQTRIDKYHLALITGLISALVFALFQGFTRYSPYARLIQCSGNSAFKSAIDANISLNEAKIDHAVNQLQTMQRQQPLSLGCEAILHDLQYSQAIYLRAGIDNNPDEAVKVLCTIPERYYLERNIQPWFTRWSSLYRKTSFPTNLKTYVSVNNCPAFSFLSR